VKRHPEEALNTELEGGGQRATGEEGKRPSDQAAKRRFDTQAGGEEQQPAARARYRALPRRWAAPHGAAAAAFSASI
jgi:hypothetical protein